jgi:hypothetical protein
MANMAMTCESGIGERHWMRTTEGVYVLSIAGREVGEVVACRRCADLLAADPDATRAEWSHDSQGEPTLTLTFPSRGSRRFISEKS